MNAEVRCGWRYNSGGLHVPPKTTGVLIYRFGAAEGVFAELKVKFLICAYHETLLTNWQYPRVMARSTRRCFITGTWLILGHGTGRNGAGSYRTRGRQEGVLG